MLCRKFKDKSKRKFKSNSNHMILLKKYKILSNKIKSIKIKTYIEDDRKKNKNN